MSATFIFLLDPNGGTRNCLDLRIEFMASQNRTQQQIDHLLDALEHDLPSLVYAHSSPGDFWDVFMRRVDPIEEIAESEDVRVLTRLNAMLAPYGMRIASVE